MGGEQRERSETFLGKELPALAREVARVEAVRVYAGEFLKIHLSTVYMLLC